MKREASNVRIAGAVDVASGDQILHVGDVHVPEFSVTFFTAHLMVAVGTMIAADAFEVALAVAELIGGVGQGEHVVVDEFVVGFDR